MLHVSWKLLDGKPTKDSKAELNYDISYCPVDDGETEKTEISSI